MIQAKSKTEPHTEPAIIGVLAFLPPKEAASEELTASSPRVNEIAADDEEVVKSGIDDACGGQLSLSLRKYIRMP